MTDDIKDAAAADNALARLLDCQVRYGIDQETMLIYMSSLNLMSILQMLERKVTGSSSAIALPAVAPGAMPSGGQSLESMAAALARSLANQGGGSGGQGINPQMLMNLLGVLGQNVDMGSLMSMLSGLLGSGAKTASRPEAGTGGYPPAGQYVTKTGGAAGENMDASGEKQNAGEAKTDRREVPRIMKWDNLDGNKKA